MFARRKPDFRRAFLSERGEAAAADAGNAASAVFSAAVGLPRHGAAVGAVCTRVPCLRQAAVSPAEAALRPQSPLLRLPSRMNIARSASAARCGQTSSSLEHGGTCRRVCCCVLNLYGVMFRQGLDVVGKDRSEQPERRLPLLENRASGRGSAEPEDLLFVKIKQKRI